jgi:hypothetical protein
VDLCRRHLRFGWWTLLLFLSLGVVLEALHGFKVGAYLDVSNATRRHMWTLAHAHGTLLSLIHVAFALTLRALSLPADGWRQIASPCLLGASVLLPGGFFLGGAIVYGGDPFLGVLLVPVGAGLLAIAVFLTARGLRELDRALPGVDRP